MQEEMDQLEAEGKIFIIRPDEPVTVSRFERDKMKLQALYGSGRRITMDKIDALCEYLEIPVPQIRPEVIEMENQILGQTREQLERRG